MELKFDTCLKFSDEKTARMVANINAHAEPKRIFLPKSGFSDDKGYVWVVFDGEKYLRDTGVFE